MRGWTVDLRSTPIAGSPGPQRVQLPTPRHNTPEMLVRACFDTMAAIERIRAERESQCPPLPGLDGVRSRPLREAVDGMIADRDRESAWRKEGGRLWVVKVAEQIKRERGGALLARFVPPEGNDYVREYRDELRAKELSPKTVKDRLSILRASLVWAAEHAWIPTPPLIPRAAKGKEGVRRVNYDWIDAQTFRRLRSEIYGTPAERGALAGALKKHGRTDDPDDLIERRRLYLSFAFYCGYHTADLDAIRDDWVSLARGLYLRHNEKSARTIADCLVEMPGPLRVDVATELVRRGIDAFPRGDKIAGGRWSTVGRVLSQTAERIGIGVHVNPRVLRRSFVRELALRGYTEEEVVTLMGHADSTMVKNVYLDPQVASVPKVRTRWVDDTYPEQPETAPVIRFEPRIAR